MDAFRLNCPRCGSVFSAKPEHEGKTVACPVCKAKIRANRGAAPSSDNSKNGSGEPANRMDVVCPNCSKQLTFLSEHAGKTGKCSGCGAIIEIPDPDVDAAVAQSQEGPELKPQHHPEGIVSSAYLQELRGLFCW